MLFYFFFFFFSSRRRHTRCSRDWSSDVCSSDLTVSPAMHQHVVRLAERGMTGQRIIDQFVREHGVAILMAPPKRGFNLAGYFVPSVLIVARSEEHTSELQSRLHLVCRLLLEKKKKTTSIQL